MSRSCQPVTKISDFCDEVNDSTIFLVKLPYYEICACHHFSVGSTILHINGVN